MRPINVFIADDHPIVRDGFKTILELQDGIEVIGTARQGKEAVQWVYETEPDVILLDVYMPDMDGIEATRQVKRDRPQTRVLLITSNAEEALIMKALMHGASGFLLKDWETERIVRAIRDSLQGQIVLPDLVSETLSETLAETRTSTKNTIPDVTHIPWEHFSVNLSEQDKQILTLLYEGCRNADIAGRLFLSVGTVKNYISRIYKTLGVENRAEAVTLIQSVKKG